MPVEQVTPSSDHEALLGLLRTRGLSVRGMDERKREELRRFLDYLCNERGMSLNDVAKLIGNKTSGYSSWLCRQLGVTVRPFEEARLKGIKEKRRKYERRPFDGSDEDKAYMLGLRHGDLSVSRPFRGAIRVSTSSTHPKMVQLFRALFEPHGHVYQHPRYKKDTMSYEWNLSTTLDESFAFLEQGWKDAHDWIACNPSRLTAYLAGLFDAEGSVGIYPAKRLTALTVAFYNTDLELMQFVWSGIESLGFHPLEPYLDKKKGFRSPGYKIEMKKDYWRVLLCRFEECQKFLSLLPIRHGEKAAKRKVASGLTRGQEWNLTRPLVEALRSSIHAERDDFVAEARRLCEEKIARAGVS